MRIRPLCLAAASVFALTSALPATASRAATQRPFPIISMTGEGSVSVAPDTAHATAGVSTEGKTAREAADANARLMAAVVAAAKEAGVPDGDIQTARFSVQPVHAPRRREEGPQLVGYRAVNQVRVRIRDTEKVGEVLDRLVAAGATNVSGVEFTVSDPSTPLDEARAAAFADAKRKAELYARAAGAQIGRAISIVEPDAGGPRPLSFRAAAAAGAAAPPTPVAPGEEALRVQVSVSFELLQ